MSLPPPPIFQDANGLWFLRCGKCHAVDGAFRSQNEAAKAYYRHQLRVHT